MYKITRIEKQQKQKERYSIFIDDAFAFGVMENTLLQFQLHVGKTLPPKEQNQILKFDQFQRLYFKGVNYISYALRTEYEVRQKLEKSLEKTDNKKLITFHQKLIDLVIQQLKRDGYINDDYFVEAYIQHTLEITQKGQFAIEQALIKKGISKTIIKEKLKGISQEAVAEVATSLGQKYIDQKKPISVAQTKQNVKKHLIQKGFDFDLIDRIVNKLDYSFAINNELTHLVDEFEHVWGKFEKKYADYELQQKVMDTLLAKGYPSQSIQQCIKQKRSR